MKVIAKIIKEIEVDVDNKYEKLLTDDFNRELRNELWDNLASELKLPKGPTLIRNDKDLLEPGLLEIKAVTGQVIVER